MSDLNPAKPIRISSQPRPVDLISIAGRKPDKPSESASNASFKEMFSRELAGSRDINFSKHAQQRLFSRDIAVSDNTLGRIADAIDKADARGARETLILSDRGAFVVAVPSRTVVTAFDPNNLREGVVTSIDSAIMI
ncbi:MAG: TIGR02530 family flagellar biosynthesis protein [Candidatus Zixiibacteriota bacterium]